MTGKSDYNLEEELSEMMNDKHYKKAEEKIRGFEKRIQETTRLEEVRILKYELDQYFKELEWDDEYLLLIFEQDFNRLREELSLKAF